MKNETVSQINMILIFIIANLLALILLPAYKIYENSMGGEENNPWIAVYYVIYIIGITAIILYIAKKSKTNLLRGIFYFAIAWAMWYALFPLFYYLWIPFSDLISLSLAIIITVILIKNPEWYLVDIVGIFVTVGIALILGVSLGIIPIVIFLSILAIYDAISVYKTKHMISLADNVIKYNLPALFVVPSKSNFSFKKVKGISKNREKGGREAYYMGYGDVLIPSILVISAARNFGFISALFTLVGSLLTMLLLTAMVNTGKPQPGLPYLNAGALAGLILSLLLC